SAIFDVQISVIQDEELAGRVRLMIGQGFTAERAFDTVMVESREHFARSANAMMRERVGDLTDVHIRVLSVLLGLPDYDPVDLPKGANAILITHDLTPSLTLQLDRECIAAIATDAGTRTSHVAILARSLGLPAVVGLLDATTRIETGDRVILDGTAGTLLVRPTTAELSQADARSRAEALQRAQLAKVAGAEAITADGVRLTLRANVDLPDEVGTAATSGADGVGLMRTEFLVVGRASMPTEDEQYTSRIHSLAGVPSACASTSRSSSKRSCGRCCGPQCMGTCASCCPSWSRSTRSVRRASCSKNRPVSWRLGGSRIVPTSRSA
ncbi:phosphoenolpyruvate--protein phosphotransferase, partial [bacterium]|nr:phosphoenolpyruvate--protein phosphotransferase [bacterium]